MDEPFYAHYLKATGLDHPGREEVLASQSFHLPSVFQEIRTSAQGSNVFLKNMGHHMRALDLQSFMPFTNFFLIRHPANMIFSFSKVIENPSIDDLGLKDQVRIYKALLESARPVVIDSSTILKEPRIALESLCLALGLDFEEQMLSWPAGKKEIDGSWAKFWYSNAHKSTGFIKQELKIPKVEERYKLLFDEAMDYYNYLKQFEIKN